MNNSNRLQHQIDSLKWGIKIQKENNISCMLEDTELLLYALEEKQERDNPKPLPFAELKQMEGAHVWVRELYDTESCALIYDGLYWNHGVEKIRFVKGRNCLPHAFVEDYNKTYFVYAHRPKEEK